MPRIQIDNSTTLQQFISMVDMDYGLIVRYRIHENTGTKLYDISGNGLNGTIVGANWSSDNVSVKYIGYVNNISINSLNNTFVYLSNGYIYNISATGNSTMQFYFNSSAYVLDNFNVTEGQSRLYSPINYATAGSTFTIASNLTDSVSVSVIKNVDLCQVGDNTNQTEIYDGAIYYIPICLNSTQALFVPNIHPGNNQFGVIQYLYAPILSSNSGLTSAELMMFFIIFVIIGAGMINFFTGWFGDLATLILFMFGVVFMIVVLSHLLI
jgi:hypothetical protein